MGTVRHIIPTTNAGKKFAGVIHTPLLKPVFTPFSPSCITIYRALLGAIGNVSGNNLGT